MIALSYAALLFCLEGGGFAILALWHDSRATLNRIAALVGLIASFWGFCLIFELAADPVTTAPLFYRLSSIGEYWINPAIAWLMLAMVPLSRRRTVLVLLPFCLAAALIFSDWWLNDLAALSLLPGPWGNTRVWAQGASWLTVSDVLFLGLYLTCAAVLIRTVFTIPSQRQRHVVKVTLIGLAVTLPLVQGLNYVTFALSLPDLRFLSGMVLMAFNGYLMFRYRYLRPPMPPLEEGFPQTLSDPAFLLNSQGVVLGTNEAGQVFAGAGKSSLVGTDFSHLLDNPNGFRSLWNSAVRRQGHFDLSGIKPLKSFSPHYDRFGDFLGALVLLRTDAGTDPMTTRLSERENEILELLVKGLSYRAIASRLFIAAGTVKRHAHNILQKTGSKDRRGLYRTFGDVRQ
jgi:DNA-binding CsgD family transcriptional regulator